MLECVDLEVSYTRGKVAESVLRGVSLRVDSVPVSIMGPSGSGKSTLLRCIAGQQKPDEGSITLDDVAIRFGVAPAVSMVDQDHGLIEFLSVKQNLSIAAEVRRRKFSAADSARLLALVGMAGSGDYLPNTLSGGQQQRVAIARALATGCRVLVADEPTGALDEENSLVIGDVLADLSAAQGTIVVVATHDKVLADRIGNIALLHSGQLMTVSSEFVL